MRFNRNISVVAALASSLALAWLMPSASANVGAATTTAPFASAGDPRSAPPAQRQPVADRRGSGTASPRATTGTQVAGRTDAPAPALPHSLPTARPMPPPVVPTLAPLPPPTTAWPGPSNTGVPAGTALTPSGSITITVPGTVIDARDINGCISVQAINVTIKRTRVRGGVCGSNQIEIVAGVSGLLIVDTEVDGMNQNSFYSGIGGTGFTCLRCNVHNVGQGFHLNADLPTVIQDSYVHDLYECCGSHNEDIYVGDAILASLTIRHNTLDNQFGQTSAISLFADLGPILHVTVDHNLMNGGGYTLYGGSTCPKNYCTQTAYIVVTDNHFGRLYYPNCGQYGPVTAFDPSRPGNVWSGNVWDDTGQPIGP